VCGMNERENIMFLMDIIDTFFLCYLKISVHFDFTKKDLKI